MGRLDVGKQFLNDLLAKIPEEKRAAVAEAFEAPEAEDAVVLLGDGTLRQQDYSKKMEGVTGYKKTLDDWYETNKAALDAAKKPIESVRPNTEGLLTRDEFIKEVDKRLDEREAGVVPFVTTIGEMGIQHFMEFGEKLKYEPLYQDPDIKKLGLIGVYEKIYGPKLAEKRAKAEEKRINDLVDTRVAEERRKQASRPPYPTGPTDVSPLDAIEHPPEQPSVATVEDMTAEYDKLVGERLTRTGAVSA